MNLGAVKARFARLGTLQRNEIAWLITEVERLRLRDGMTWRFHHDTGEAARLQCADVERRTIDPGGA